MNSIVFLVMRRMRQPMVTLVLAYTVAVVGLVLIPGRDADGDVWHMGIFQAFYVVSYTSTTIGFGEIPYPFTDAQRMWVSVVIYATVVAWIYALGTMLSLLQDQTFQEAIRNQRFVLRVRRTTEPFYLVCGYGETGSALVNALTEHGHHAVVVDMDEARTNLLKLENLREYVPALHGDAGRPQTLIDAGLGHRYCEGVVALTNSNAVNLQIAIGVKLMRPSVKAICRADSHEVEANMASFGTDHIIDPFDTFAAHLATALHAPCTYLLNRWLTGVENSEVAEPVYPPRDGHWVICGYGRFGKAVYQKLKHQGVTCVVVEATPERTGRPDCELVEGWGTEAATLRAARITEAVGLVAGTDNDANNLSIVMTAKDLNPGLFVTVRQNLEDNKTLFDKVDADMVMHPSTIIADRIRVLLDIPLVHEFTERALMRNDAWACQLVSRISALVEDRVPLVRTIDITPEDTPPLHCLIREGHRVTVGQLLRDPWERNEPLPIIALMLERGDDEYTALPADDTALHGEDRLLLCGTEAAFTRLGWTLGHFGTLNFVLHGTVGPEGWVWQRLRRRRRV